MLNKVKFRFLSVKTISRFFLLYFTFLVFNAAFSIARQNEIDSLLQVLNVVKDDTAKVVLLNEICVFYKDAGEYDTAIQFANQLLHLTQKLDDKSGIANAYNAIGLIWYEQSDYSKALEYFFKSLAENEKIGNKKGLSRVHNNIGNIYQGQGNYSEAMNHYLKSAKIKEDAGDKKGIAGIYINIGLLYDEQGNLEKALEYYLKSKEIYEEINNKRGLSVAYNNLGTTYQTLQNYSEALKYCLKSLILKQEINDKKGIVYSEINIGGLYIIANQLNYDSIRVMFPNIKNISPDVLKNSMLDSARHFFLKSLASSKELSDDYLIQYSLKGLGDVASKKNQWHESINYYEQAAKLADTLGFKKELSESYLALSNSHEQLNDYEHAYRYHKLFSEAKDSVFNEESQKQITEMQTKYETDKKEKEIQLLNKDKEIQNKDLQRQKTIRNAVAGGLLLVLLFSFVLINRLLLIRKQKKVIEIEREKSEKLLLNILPKEIAEELKINNSVTPQFYKLVTVMFTDFKGFTTIAEKMSAEELVSELDFIFKKFDEIISKYPIEKIKTIGDAYMCAGGLPVANTTNPMDVVLAALEIQGFMEKLAVGSSQLANEEKKLQTLNWKLRIGIHTGSVIAGVVGDRKFAYDIWGDTVNTASRMESSGEAGKVNISGATYELIKKIMNKEQEFTNDEVKKQQTTNCKLQTIYRGKIPAKNKGEIEMYFVEKV